MIGASRSGGRRQEIIQCIAAATINTRRQNRDRCRHLLHHRVVVLRRSGALLPRERLQEMIRAYNQARGWSPEGLIPTERIRTLDLLDLVS